MSATPGTAKPAKMRSERLKRGLSVREVAEAIGVDPSNLSRIELGGQTPTREVARALHGFYGGRVPLADVYDPLFRLKGA